MCGSAWESMYVFVMALAHGGGDFYDSWMRNPKSAMISCNDGTWTYTWEHGRELASMTDGSTTWNYTYDADGMRTKRTNGSMTYAYVYNGGQLSQMTVGSNTLYFAYDASGTPMSVTYNGTAYYYVTNIQGDVTKIVNASGTTVVDYTYDTWGALQSTTDSMASTLGKTTPCATVATSTTRKPGCITSRVVITIPRWVGLLMQMMLII
jgi:YD repeat-containing protein